MELMPSPLPGCETPQQLLPLLTWAMQLLQNPRVRESDAGARTLQLVASKYLVGLGWTLTVAPKPSVTAAGAAGAAVEAPASDGQVVAAAAAWLGSLTSQLRSQLMSAHADMAAASRHGLVHGPLLALKYTVEVLPWQMLASSSAQVSVVVSAAAAAACGLSSTAAASGGCGSNGSSDEQQLYLGVVVCGPASAVLHCWVTDLVALLTAAADLVKPLLSAQV
jgi:hypothetical protein